MDGSLLARAVSGALCSQVFILFCMKSVILLPDDASEGRDIRVGIELFEGGVQDVPFRLVQNKYERDGASENFSGPVSAS